MKEVKFEEGIINRRQMLKALGCCGAALFLGGCSGASDKLSVSDGQKSLCPYGMVNDPYPGFCLAYQDEDGDGICDCSLVVVTASDGIATPPANTATLPANFVPECEFGYTYDPYPGHCHKYIDSDQSGYCDYSEPPGALIAPTRSTKEQADSLPVEPTVQAAAASTTGVVACPFGLVNDPYPGQCQRYVDANGSGFCDYSEIQISGGEEVAGDSPGSEVPSALAGLPRDFIPSCPYGFQYDPYPGRCHNYIDSDGSGYCDHSEPISASLPVSGEGGGSRGGRGNGHGWHGQYGDGDHDDD